MDQTRVLNFVALGLSILVILVFAALALTGVGHQSLAQETAAETATPHLPTEAPVAELTGTPTPLPKPDGTLISNTLYVPEVSVLVTLPSGYGMQQNTEANRRGSFVSYDLTWMGDRLYPTLYEIQFFTYDSIKAFTANCGPDILCFEGDYPTTDRYNRQYEAFSQNISFDDYPLVSLGNHRYFVSSFPCTGNSCIIREYTTFLDEIKVDVWVMMDDEGQIEEADALAAQVVLDTENAPAVTAMPAQSRITAPLGEQFTLQPDQFAIASDQSMTMTLGTIQDSRCPLDVQCIQAGSVIVELIITTDAATSIVSLTLEAGAEPVSTMFESYEITLIAVDPYPASATDSPTAYTVTLMVDQALTN